MATKKSMNLVENDYTVFIYEKSRGFLAPPAYTVKVIAVDTTHAIERACKKRWGQKATVDSKEYYYSFDAELTSIVEAELVGEQATFDFAKAS